MFSLAQMVSRKCVNLFLIWCIGVFTIYLTEKLSKCKVIFVKITGKMNQNSTQQTFLCRVRATGQRVTPQSPKVLSQL